jgi:small subunit ribosomal protein S15
VMLSKTKKQRAVKEVRTHETDTGSPEVQIAILTKKIEELAKHLKKNTRDKHSRRGLLGMVAKRQKHLNYISKKNPTRYKSLTRKLGLKKQK